MTTQLAPREAPPASDAKQAAVARMPRRSKPAAAGNGEDRLRLIAEAAYYRAAQRGSTPGRELDDWLAAEIDVDALLGDDRRAV
jgi:hypothetical protein